MSRSGSRSSDGHPTKIAGLYDLEETLGRGHFAVVKLARHVFTGEKVAVKVIDKTKLDPVSQDHLYQEVRCMKLVQHPNVVRLYEVIDTNSKLYLILELGDGGDLYDYIMKHEAGLSEMDARDYFAQIVRAISFCHKLHVVHRDLKPENVVFFERLGIVKLTDFGFSNRFNPGQKLETSCGSLAYSAPEILLGDSYDAPAVDVWSLGVILYMLVAGRAPFQEANDSETLTMIMDVRYRVPEHVSEQCKRLIGRMLVRDPQARATLGEIAADPWLEAAMALQSDPPDLPLVSRETVSEEDHQFILTKMVNGKIASKEDILEALDKDEYNHITATYYLLAERKLRLLRAPKKPPASVSKNHPATGTHCMGTSGSLNPPLVNVERCSDAEPGSAGGVSPSRVNQALLSMSRHPGDVASRSRKCSIVTEEEDDEEERESGGAHDRRGSRSEGKLNLAVAELRRESILLTEASTAPTPLMLSKCSQQSSQASTSGGFGHVTPPVLHKTLPASLSTAAGPSPGLDGISEEGGSTPGGVSGTPSSGVSGTPSGGPGTSGRGFVPSNTSPTTSTRVTGYSTPLASSSNTSLTSLVKLSFRKSRTASVSSSEASDEDEARHSRRGSTKSLGGHTTHPPGPPGGDRGGGGGTGGHQGGNLDPAAGPAQDKDNNSSSQNPADSSNNNTGSNSSSNSGAGGSTQSNSIGDSVSGGSHGNRHTSARHKRRGGETRLRESQSLNRITEVVETEVGERLSAAERVTQCSRETSAHIGAESEPPEGERKESECFRCCMEEMCLIEKRLVCERRLSGEDVERVEHNNNVVDGKTGDGCESEGCEENERSMSERLGQVRESIGNSEGGNHTGCAHESSTGEQILSPSGSGHSQATSVHSSSSQTRNLTNVYSRHNKHRYIHNSSTAGGGGGKGAGVVKTNYLISSISCNDIPDGCHGNGSQGNGSHGNGSHGNQVNLSETRGETGCHGDAAGLETPSAADKSSSRRFNTLTRLRNRHNKENNSSGGGDAECKQKSPLPSNGLAGKSPLPSNGLAGKSPSLPSNGLAAGTNQNASATSNGGKAALLPVVKSKKSKQNTLINRYLYLQKKLVMPLFGGGRKAASIKAEGRLYKAKSCSEVEKTSCTGNAKVNVLSKHRGAMTMTRCSKHVTECTTGPLKVTASIVNIDHRTSTLI